MVGRADEDKRRTDQTLEAKRDAGALDARGDREVDLTIGHEAQHGLRIGVDDAHFYVGVLCSELADGVDDVDAPRYEDRCDADRPPKQSLDSVYGVAGPFGVLHCGPRGPEKGSARVGQC